jgi:hypothetical protein
VWKADHVVVVVCHGPILVVPELTPKCASNDSHRPKLFGLAPPIVVAGRQAGIGPFFRFE